MYIDIDHVTLGAVERKFILECVVSTPGVRIALYGCRYFGLSKGANFTFTVYFNDNFVANQLNKCVANIITGVSFD